MFSTKNGSGPLEDSPNKMKYIIIYELYTTDLSAQDECKGYKSKMEIQNPPFVTAQDHPLAATLDGYAQTLPQNFQKS